MITKSQYHKTVLSFKGGKLKMTIDEKEEILFKYS